LQDKIGHFVTLARGDISIDVTQALGHPLGEPARQSASAESGLSGELDSSQPLEREIRCCNSTVFSYRQLDPNCALLSNIITLTQRLLDPVALSPRLHSPRTSLRPTV
jgi:hypothetical protein